MKQLERDQIGVEHTIRGPFGVRKCEGHYNIITDIIYTVLL